MRSWNFPTCLLLALLAGCPSSNSETTEPASPVRSTSSAPPGNNAFVHFEGIWQGTMTPDDTMTSVPALVVVNGWGEFRLLGYDAQFVGFPRRTSTDLEGDLIGILSPGFTWSDGTRISSFRISGTIDADNFIEANYAGSGGTGSMALAWVAGSDSGTIGPFGGTWSLFDENRNIVATFNFGFYRLFGSHSNGCAYSGIGDTWTSNNSLDIPEFSISSCPPVAGVDMNGAYSGTAFLADIANDGTETPALVVALSNDENQVTWFLYQP